MVSSWARVTWNRIGFSNGNQVTFGGLKLQINHGREPTKDSDIILK